MAARQRRRVCEHPCPRCRRSWSGTRCICQRDVAVLRFLAERPTTNVLLHQRNGTDETIADVAAINGHSGVLEWLASPASGGCEELVKATAADPNVMCIAADYGHVSVIKFAFHLAGPSAFVDPDDDGFTVAQCAATQGHPDIVGFVVSACGAAALEAVPGTTPVPHLLASTGSVVGLKQVAPLLGASMAGRDGLQLTIAHSAAAHGQIDVLRWIAKELPGGRHILASRDDRLTVVQSAAAAGHIAVLEYLNNEFDPGLVMRCCASFSARTTTKPNVRPSTRGVMDLMMEAARGNARGQCHVAVLDYLEELCGTSAAILRPRLRNRTVSRAAARNGSMHALRFVAGAQERYDTMSENES